MQDCVLDISEDEADVLCVNGSGKVMVEGFHLLLTPLAAETFHQELLYIGQIVGLSSEVGEIVSDWHSLYFVLQQICLIEEKNDGRLRKHTVVDDGVKYVERLHEPVGLTVLHKNLVKLARWRQEEDRSDTVEALEPSTTLWPLTAHIYHLERNVLDLKVILVDAFRRLSCQKDVLLGW